MIVCQCRNPSICNPCPNDKEELHCFGCGQEFDINNKIVQSALKLQVSLKQLLETPLYTEFRGYPIHEEGDKHLWDLLVELVKK